MSGHNTLKNISGVASPQHSSLQQLQNPHTDSTSSSSTSQMQSEEEGEEGKRGEEGEEGEDGEKREAQQIETTIPQQLEHVSNDPDPPRRHLQGPSDLTQDTPEPPSPIRKQTSWNHHRDSHDHSVRAPYLKSEHINGNGVRSSSSHAQLPRLNTSFYRTLKNGSGSVVDNTEGGNSPMAPRRSRGSDPRNPLVVLMPASAQPTEVLSNRFSAWRSVIRSVITYLTETASIQDEIVRQQLRLTHAVQFPFFVADGQKANSNEEKAVQNFFMPAGSGSIQELPSILNQYHGTIASHASRMSKELTSDVIPRLEDLRRDLLVKIKEIKSLQSDFKNSCFKELQQTKIDMKRYLESIEEAHRGPPKHDPYLAKIALDRQIRKQLSEENFVHEAFDNLESSGSELENVVVMEIQNALTIYARLIGEESQLVFDILLSRLDCGFLSRDPAFEWDNFIKKDPNFIAPNLPMRKLKEISYKHQFDPLSYEIRSGVLERRSKFLKSYSKGYYVLTPNFLHEFKTSDRKKDQVPLMSLPLGECTVTEHSKPGSSDDKFVLHAKQNGIIHRGHNWVFRSENYESMMAWFEDLKILTSLNGLTEKNRFIQEKLNLTSDGRPNQIPTATSPNAGLPRNSTDRSLRGYLSGSASGYSGLPLQHSRHDLIGNPSTPRLDNQTNTATTSSLPDTNKLDMSSDSMGNIYASSLDNETRTSSKR
ncbi:phosphoinositide PI4,5P(2) binding protein [Zygosaccharomyces mellis]|uniref:Phosphoinositide PI4,5P(2) binding protein n=1 Tax=Zygosaccharomyces mellis TaxID=42258 RepID=A0A4C2DZU3_9SACH|nr:phosphoinositide PI4,5P(2) binding protein [Zygosaccharomyces mellis]